jgi:uracil-DNA glycosylase
MDTEILTQEIRACRLCTERFRATRTAHAPSPVAWLSGTAPIMICSQAPGMRAHLSGLPFDDASGDRLRDWMGIDRETFYDRNNLTILPMAFCFPGYDSNGSDIAPPRVCARTWRDRALAAMPGVRLTLLIGAYAQGWHLGPHRRRSVAETVAAWRAMPEGILPLPHPSWRNTAWLRRNPWFEAELVPVVRARVCNLLQDR